MMQCMPGGVARSAYSALQCGPSRCNGHIDLRHGRGATHWALVGGGSTRLRRVWLVTMWPSVSDSPPGSRMAQSSIRCPLATCSRTNTSNSWTSTACMHCTWVYSRCRPVKHDLCVRKLARASCTPVPESSRSIIETNLSTAPRSDGAPPARTTAVPQAASCS